MKIVEGKTYLETKHFDLASYMSNFSRERQTRDNNVSKNKLTLADLENYRSKTNKVFITDKESDY